MARDQEKVAIPLKSSSATEYGDAVELQVTELMSATKAGSREAFDELTVALRNRAFCVARSLVGSHDDAMDMTQEAFLKTYRARATYRDGDPFLPWFHRILRNTCFSYLRKKNRLRSYSLSRENDEDGSSGNRDRQILNQWRSTDGEHGHQRVHNTDLP